MLVIFLVIMQLALKAFVERRTIFISIRIILVLISSLVQNLLFMFLLFVPLMWWVLKVICYRYCVSYQIQYLTVHQLRTALRSHCLPNPAANRKCSWHISWFRCSFLEKLTLFQSLYVVFVFFLCVLRWWQSICYVDIAIFWNEIFLKALLIGKDGSIAIQYFILTL